MAEHDFDPTVERTDDESVTLDTLAEDEGKAEDVDAPRESYPVGENGYPDLEQLKLTADDHQELVDTFLSNKFGSEYIAQKLDLAHRRNEGE